MSSMANGLWEKLRGAHRIELFAALVIAALLALMVINGMDAKPNKGESELELRMERVLSRIDGAGRVSAMITQDEDGRVTGVVVVADGLDDLRTYLCLQRAVEALLGVEAHSIEIIGKDAFGGTL